MKKPKSSILIDACSTRVLRSNEEHDPTEMNRGAKIKLIYGSERTRWEALKAGRPVQYIFPKKYNGQDALCIDGDEDAQIEKAQKSQWVTLASWIEDLKLPPKAFMSMVFDSHLITNRRALEPRQIMTERYFSMWESGKERLSERIRVSLHTESSAAACEFALQRVGSTKRDAWVAVLFDTSLAVSPLYRYCVSVALNQETFDRIGETFFADAVMQFERYRQFYKEHWGRILPCGFSQQSLRAFPSLALL